MDKLLSGKRKLVVTLSMTLLVLGVASIFLWVGKVDSAQWVDIAKWLGAGGMAAFAVGNGMEHLGKP